ncbi:hypothetical protein L1987_60934 [Smallanthus sonchifolius]|uniref:Uncharacterized protein n=1 Tax=Smallanthus sonchifolius TaxID=185202 RepID=A0ACB9D9C5_9ASTR|nr:hypothetical protein L1987_60934 [Smallanthus sonchifolius]
MHGDSVDPQNDSDWTPSVENHGEEFSFAPEVENREIGRNVSAGPVMDSEDEEGGRGPTYGCTYKVFRDCDLPILDSMKDAIATVYWITRMEATIDMSECHENQCQI